MTTLLVADYRGAMPSHRTGRIAASGRQWSASRGRRPSAHDRETTAHNELSKTGAEGRLREFDAANAVEVIDSVDADQGTSLAQRCALQAAELSLLSGVANTLTTQEDMDVAIRDVLVAALYAERMLKAALILRTEDGALQLRQHVGFSEAEQVALQRFFGYLPLLERIVEQRDSVCVPSAAVPTSTSSTILTGAKVTSLHIVSLESDGQGIGAMIVGSTRTDCISDDSVAFARTIGNQIVQSLALARSVASLRASEQRYRMLLESASDAIAVLTVDGIIREVNHRWEEITGQPRQQLIGRHLQDFTPTRTGDEHISSLGGAITARGAGPIPFELLRADGARVLIEMSSTTVEIDDESLVLTIGRDVTEHRRLEGQLRQAQKLDGLGHLAGGVAHDFNNLLTAIFGFTEIVMSQLRPDDPARDGLEEIKKASERAAALTQQLLAFSRKQIFTSRMLDINTVVAGLEPMLRRLIFENIEFDVSLAPHVGLVSMDPTQIEQILVNLVVNAVDAMPLGGRLTIETANIVIDAGYQRRHLPITGGAYVVLAVTDTGVGMDEATTKRVFEPFFTTKEPGTGTGLGLATVYGIVKQSGGDLWVYSEPGMGSTFRVYLPQAGPHARSVPPLVNVPEELQMGGETILLVEDDETVRRLARTGLERSGHTVLEAGNPREASLLAKAFPGEIHLLLSDVIMPESEGPPLLERLRASRPALRVLYMSGYADEAVIRRGLLLEGMPFLQKPFTLSVLGRRVREVLDARAES